MFKSIVQTDASPTTVIIRLMVGAVFLSEGVQKFLFSEQLGTGRFQKIGLPNPELLGPFVGAFEITCGTLILLGFFTRFATIATITIMLVAISFTKIPLYNKDGLWDMLHESRTDWAMLLGSIFLFIKGGGKWSLDIALFCNESQK